MQPNGRITEAAYLRQLKQDRRDLAEKLDKVDTMIAMLSGGQRPSVNGSTGQRRKKTIDPNKAAPMYAEMVRTNHRTVILVREAAAAAGAEWLSLGDLEILTNISQSTISGVAKALALNGEFERMTKDRFVYYRLLPEELREEMRISAGNGVIV